MPKVPIIALKKMIGLLGRIAGFDGRATWQELKSGQMIVIFSFILTRQPWPWIPANAAIHRLQGQAAPPFRSVRR